MADISLDETQEVIIRDSATSNNELKVNSDGSINVKASISPSASDLSKLFLVAQTLTFGSSESDLLLLTNPSNSIKYAYVSGLSITPITVARIGFINIYINPTISSNGTAVSTYSAEIKTNPSVSSLQVYSLPTISNRGSLIRSYTSGSNSPTSNLITAILFVIYPGKSVLLSGFSSANNSDFSIALSWSEE